VLKLRNRSAAVRSAAPPFAGHGPEGAERATFAAGCFWGVEGAFRQINGVLRTAVGYTGGHVADPSYDRVCRARNRQGLNLGSQYRSAIFYHDAGQQEAAIASRDAQQQSLRRQIATQIAPASAFYRAEEYHQQYLEKHGRPAHAATIQ